MAFGRAGAEVDAQPGARQLADDGRPQRPGRCRAGRGTPGGAATPLVLAARRVRRARSTPSRSSTARSSTRTSCCIGARSVRRHPDRPARICGAPSKCRPQACCCTCARTSWSPPAGPPPSTRWSATRRRVPAALAADGALDGASVRHQRRPGALGVDEGGPGLDARLSVTCSPLAQRRPRRRSIAVAPLPRLSRHHERAPARDRPMVRVLTLAALLLVAPRWLRRSRRRPS